MAAVHQRRWVEIARTNTGFRSTVGPGFWAITDGTVQQALQGWRTFSNDEHRHESLQTCRPLYASRQFISGGPLYVVTVVMSNGAAPALIASRSPLPERTLGCARRGVADALADPLGLSQLS